MAQNLLTNEVDPGDIAVIDLSRLLAERKVVIASVVSLSAPRGELKPSANGVPSPKPEMH